MTSHLEWLREDYLAQPYEISLETLAVCNAACMFCPYPTLERKGTRMPDKVISDVLQQLAWFKQPFYFSPFKVNEPLLDHRLMDICATVNAAAPQAVIRLFSNGSPLTERKIDDIAQLDNVAHLWISLNSTNADDYRELMRMEFEPTARKLDLLHTIVESGFFKHPVMVSRVMDGTVRDYGFISYCSNRWPLFRSQMIKRDGWLGFVDPLLPEIPATPCVRWFELSILATGVVSLCCMDGKGEFPIGDIHTQSLLEIYNAPGWRERRERMISRAEIHPCSTCTY